MKQSFIDDFKAARRASVPLLAIESQDYRATMATIAKLPTKKPVPIVSWDIIDGMRGRNDAGNQALQAIFQEIEAASAMSNPSEALSKAAELPDKTIFFMLNGHRYIGDRTTNEASVGQAIWNLRDRFKQNERTLVIMTPGVKLPPELKQDVLVLNEELPTPEELRVVVERIYKDAGLNQPPNDIAKQAAESLRGLSLYSAEQAVAMSIQPTGVDLEKLWDRKRKTVEQTPGLSIYNGRETYDDIRGVSVFKDYIAKLFNGEDAPTGIVFLDEIEKMFAGIGGDLSGTSQEQHGEFLRWSQDNKVPGIILVGHPGCSKTFVAKCAAGEFKKPMIEANFSAFKGSLVGQTGAQTRDALKVVLAVMKPIMIATSNSLAILPPELRRRFKFGTWFFDLPTKEERDAVWDLYMKKYKITSTKPEDADWTPSDIETCCELAWRLKCSLTQASQYFVPVSKSSPDKIELLRQQSSGKFLNASVPGVYYYNKKMPNDLDPTRKVTFSGAAGEA